MLWVMYKHVSVVFEGTFFSGVFNRIRFLQNPKSNKCAWQYHVETIFVIIQVSNAILQSSFWQVTFFTLTSSLVRSVKNYFKACCCFHVRLVVVIDCRNHQLGIHYIILNRTNLFNWISEGTLSRWFLSQSDLFNLQRVFSIKSIVRLGNASFFLACIRLQSQRYIFFLFLHFKWFLEMFCCIGPSLSITLKVNNEIS